MSQPIQISLDKTNPYQCIACKGELFEQVNFLRIVPAILSPTMRKEIFPVPAFRCCKCKIIADLNPVTIEKPQ
jgi:hypothetical protein